MLGAMIQFQALPRIGFAHHFYMKDYRQSYAKKTKSFELVYVKSGKITAQLYDQVFQVQPGSVFVLFRHLPITLTSADGAPQTHCSVELIADYSFSLLEKPQNMPEMFKGLVLPFIIPPGEAPERIKKQLHAIVSQLGMSREKYAMSASLKACGILAELDEMFRHQLQTGKNSSSLLEYKIKQYITEHIHQNIPLSALAAELNKTPNYLNSVFKASEGISLHRYINREKVRLIGELMENKGVSFQIACENVAISDISYGYRMFKKHMGVTPSAYLAGKRHIQP